MELIYLSGPISSDNEIGIYKNIVKAAEICALLRIEGYSVICPHTSSMFHGSMLDHDKWIKQDIRQLQVCTKMFLMEGWEYSVGCNKEIDFALKNNIPIYDVFLANNKVCFKRNSEIK